MALDWRLSKYTKTSDKIVHIHPNKSPCKIVSMRNFHEIVLTNLLQIYTK